MEIKFTLKVLLLIQSQSTFFARFKIPVRLVRSDKDVCSVRAQSKLAAVFRTVRLIVWDEISMTNRKDLEAVDRSLRDLRKQDCPFGGIVVVCAGDFRQLLPVVKNGTRANNILACVSKSPLWSLFRRHRLSKNIRLQSCADAELYHRYMQLLMQVSFVLAVFREPHSLQFSCIYLPTPHRSALG